MKISIITVTYNSAQFLENCIESVNKQSYRNVEHIIIDGASTDGTLDIIKKHEQQIVKWISEKDDGLYYALNKGINMSTGDIVGVLHSDDFFAYPEALEDIVTTFKMTHAEALYADLKYVDTENTNKIKRTWKAGAYYHNSFLFGWMPPHPTFYVKKEIYNKYGTFNTDLTSSADYELMLRFLYKHKIKPAYLPKTLICMRIGGISNRNMGNRVKANMEDRKAWKLNHLKPYFFTLWLKPLRKIGQFFKA